MFETYVVVAAPYLLLAFVQKLGPFGVGQLTDAQRRRFGTAS